jgi:hypothetical protein
MPKFMTKGLATPALRQATKELPRALHEWEIESELPERDHHIDPVYASQLAWWTRGYNAAEKIYWAEKVAAEHGAERAWRILDRGGFGVSIIKPQGKTFEQLQASRAGGAI